MKARYLFLLVLPLLAAQCTKPVQAADTALAATEAGFVQLAQSVRPFVVNIDTEGAVEQKSSSSTPDYHDLFRFFGIPETPEQGPRMRVGLASGFIIDKQGHILTNNHVAEGAQVMKVRTSDGKEYTAKLVGRDPDSDVAVIQIQPEGDLPVAPLGDSGQLKVGQYAIACGSPSGFEGSFSFGHISALGRNQLPLPGLRFENFIQTDAAINPGNSGGPLCDINGQVMGINIAIVAGANSIGFAIPINTAKRILPALIQSGRVVRGFLGVGVTDVGPYASALGLPDSKGAFVKNVQSGSPADQAGIKPYDVIRKINNTLIEDSSILLQTISDQPPGTQVTLEIWRNGQPMQVTATLSEMQSKIKGTTPAQGGGEDINVENLTPQIAAQLRLPRGTTGVVIRDVNPESAWADAGLEPGDVITQVAQQPVQDVQTFHSLMSQYSGAGRAVLLGIYRHGTFDIVAVNFAAAAPAPGQQPPARGRQRLAPPQQAPAPK